MNLFHIIKKNYFYLFIVCFIFVGVLLALNTGITHDEYHDLFVWKANQNLILNKLFNSNLDTSYITGGGLYYGSGFHYISFLVEFLTLQIPIIDNFDDITKLLLSKHITVFLFFATSGIFIRKILKIITNNSTFSNLGSIFYLLYPYLLGHSFFNVKDIPFLSVWCICTYYIIRIIKTFLEKDIILKKHIIFISVLTGYLLSIRISGILIFIQYLIFIFFTTEVKKIKFLKLIRKFFKDLFIFIFLTFFIFFLLQPSYWENPLIIFQAIKYMSQHIQTVCTITLGECMKAQELPASYIPIWFFFKLPLIILFGLSLYPFIESKIKSKNHKLLIINSLGLSSVSIIILLILFEVNLYDEIRQIMFLLPSIFIISLSLIFFYSKKIFKYLILFFIIFFAIQNIKIYPYNYVWINNFSHITKIGGVFELDYWGVSTRNIASKINEINLKNSECIISNRNNGLKPFLREGQCFIPFNDLHKNNKRPFYVSLMERALSKGLPNNCSLIYTENKNINFSHEKVSMATLYKCD